MTTRALKIQVIGKINQTSDHELIVDVYNLLENSSDDSEVYSLTDNHKNAIDAAIDQIKNGDFLTNEEANKEIDTWLNK